MTLVKINNRNNGKNPDHFFDALFNNFSAPWGIPSGQQAPGLPPVNIEETKNSYQVVLNVPGRNKEDFNINIDKNLLTISFEKQEDKKEEDAKSIRREFNFSSFKRSFSLDEKIDVNNIQAKYESGLLKIELPKKEVVKEEVKQISIQ